ncbi:two-partner secretion domain-containing protein, partial [Pseudomonas aeruginosa]
VNIATPNGAGLSNNHFRDYNVGANGLILNNATGKTQGTQLGGIILGNPNLKGQAAQVILNQVTGGNRSTLAGYTEVAGQSARGDGLQAVGLDGVAAGDDGEVLRVELGVELGAAGDQVELFEVAYVQFGAFDDDVAAIHLEALQALAV